MRVLRRLVAILESLHIEWLITPDFILVAPQASGRVRRLGLRTAVITTITTDM